jgi:hypothetical protein
MELFPSAVPVIRLFFVDGQWVGRESGLHHTRGRLGMSRDEGDSGCIP